MLQRFILSSALCSLCFLCPIAQRAHAQVVIQEEVHLSVSPAASDSLGASKTTSTGLFTAPASGELRLRYHQAIRKKPWENGDNPPSLEGHTLQIDYHINGESSSLLDVIEPSPVLAKTAGTAPRFEVVTGYKHCRSSWVAQICAHERIWAQEVVLHHSFFDHHSSQGVEYRDNAEPIISLGNVEQGDEVGLELTYTEADGEVHVLELIEIPEASLPPKVALMVQGKYFGGWYPFLGEEREALWVYVELVAPEIQFLRQNDEEIPQEGSQAHLAVSKFRTDRDLDAQTVFESPYKGLPAQLDEYQDTAIFPDFVDTYTFRPQVTGVDSGKTVEFLLEVIREGSVVSGLTQAYEAVEGVVDGGPAYRGNRHIRLVSNKQPASVPFGATYDDDVRKGPPDQTIRVELEDKVRVTLIVDTDTTKTKAELPVGLPASENHAFAVRRVEINWQWLETLNGVDPVLTTQRMSEDWAQAAIYFKINERADGSLSASTFRQNAVGNVLLVSFQKRGFAGIKGRPKIAPQAGSVSVNFEGQNVTLNYEAGQSIQEVVEAFRTTLEQDLGVEVLSHPADTEDEIRGRLTAREEAKEFYIVVGKGTDLRITSASADQNVFIDTEELNYNSLELHDLAALARSLRDDDPLTVDAFVIPDDAMHPQTINQGTYTEKVLGKGFSDDSTYYAMPHTLFIYPKATDAHDDWPLVAGHEMGHVLVKLLHAEKEYDNTYPFRQHLMYGNTAEREDLSGPKRLSMPYHTSARTSSLIQAKSRSQQ